MNGGENTHHLYYEGVTSEQASSFSSFLKNSGIYTYDNFDMEIYLSKDSIGELELYMPTTATSETSLLTQSLLSVLIFDIHLDYSKNFKVYTYYAKSNHLKTKKLVEYYSDDKFTWMKEEKNRLTVKEIAKKIKRQFVFMKELMLEADSRGYSYMAFGAIPLNIYFASNGIGSKPRRQLSRRTVSIFNNPYDTDRAIEIINVAFKNVKWPAERRTVFKSHADALTKMIRNMDIILDNWESLPKELQEPPKISS